MFFRENLHKPESFLATIYKFICLQSNFVPLYIVHLALGEESDLVFRRLPAHQFIFAVWGQSLLVIPHVDLGTFSAVALDLCLALLTVLQPGRDWAAPGLQMQGGEPWGLWPGCRTHRLGFSAVFPGFVCICHASPIPVSAGLDRVLPWQGEKNISVRQLHYITKVIWRHRYSESPLCSFLFPGTISLFSF